MKSLVCLALFLIISSSSAIVTPVRHADNEVIRSRQATRKQVVAAEMVKKHRRAANAPALPARSTVPCPAGQSSSWTSCHLFDRDGIKLKSSCLSPLGTLKCVYDTVVEIEQKCDYDLLGRVLEGCASGCPHQPREVGTCLAPCPIPPPVK